MLDQQRLKLAGMVPPKLFNDTTRVPGIGLDPRFAWLVRLCGGGRPGKWIETRTIATKYRGPLVICATSGKNTRTDPVLAESFAKVCAWLLKETDLTPDDIERGIASTNCTTALGIVTGCTELREDDWRGSKFFAAPPPGKSKRYAWHMEGIWPLHQVATRSTQGFFGLQHRDVREMLIDWIACQLDPSTVTRSNLDDDTQARYAMFDEAIPPRLSDDLSARQYARVLVQSHNVAGLYAPNDTRLEPLS